MSKRKTEKDRSNKSKRRKPIIAAIELYEKIVEAIKKEVTTPYGRVNLYTVIVIASVAVVLFLSSSVLQIGLAICTIFNHDLLKYMNRRDTLLAFILLVVFSSICIIFVYIAEKIVKNKSS